MKEELIKIAQENLSSEEMSKIVKDRFMKAIEEAVNDAFQWGDVKRAIEGKIKEVMVPYIESYDFSRYLPKLDTVLTELVNSDHCTADKNMLNNFKCLFSDPDLKEMKITDIFEKWIEFCSKKIECDGLEINYDDGVSYDPIECSMRFVEGDNPSWSNFHTAKVIFENEHDKKLNTELHIMKWIASYNQEHSYTLSVHKDVMISSIRYLDDFEILLLQLSRAGTAIVIDSDFKEGFIYPEKLPEATFN